MSSDLKSGSAIWWKYSLRPLVAYCAASVMAGFVAYPVWIFLTVRPMEARDIVGVMALGLMYAGYFAVFASLPTLGLLALVRWTSLRRGVTDTLAGGLIGALLITFVHQLGRTGLQFDDGDLFRAAQYGLAGMAGGLTYWLANGQPRSHRQAHPGGPAKAAPNQR